MRFLDVKTDFAFKKVFGSEQSKPILISFLNALLDYRDGDEITDLTIASGRIVGIGAVSDDFNAERVIDASGLVVAPMRSVGPRNSLQHRSCVAAPSRGSRARVWPSATTNSCCRPSSASPCCWPTRSGHRCVRWSIAWST